MNKKVEIEIKQKQTSTPTSIQPTIITQTMTPTKPTTILPNIITLYTDGDTIKKETKIEETTLPQTTLPQTTLPQTTLPQTTLPQTTLPQTTLPQTTLPQTTLPQTTLPQTTLPQTTLLQTTLPRTTLPQTTTPIPTYKLVIEYTGKADYNGKESFTLSYTNNNISTTVGKFETNLDKKILVIQQIQIPQTTTHFVINVHNTPNGQGDILIKRLELNNINMLPYLTSMSQSQSSSNLNTARLGNLYWIAKYTFTIPTPFPPQTTLPQTTLPQTTLPITTLPQTTLPITTLPQTTLPRTTLPQTTLPQTTLPRTTLPQTTLQQTTLPQTTLPRTTLPQTTLPQTTLPITTPPIIYSIRNMNRNECIQPYNVWLSDCNVNDANQWIYETSTNRFKHIKTNRYLPITGGSTDTWTIEGSQIKRNWRSNSGNQISCLDVETNGILRTNECNSTKNTQNWSVIPATPLPIPTRCEYNQKCYNGIQSPNGRYRLNINHDMSAGPSVKGMLRLIDTVTNTTLWESTQSRNKSGNGPFTIWMDNGRLTIRHAQGDTNIHEEGPPSYNLKVYIRLTDEGRLQIMNSDNNTVRYTIY